MRIFKKPRHFIGASILTSGLATLGTAVAQEPARPPAFQRVQGVTGEVAIVPMTDGGVDLLRILCGHSGAPAFTPTPEEVRGAEAKLVAFLRATAPPGAAELWQKASSYRRQYGGVTVGKGQQARRKLILNATCHADGEGWLNQISAAKDGGTCYYQLTYDLGSRTFSNLQVNGEG